MTGPNLLSASPSRIILRIVLLAAVVSLLAPRLSAASCTVAKHEPPTEADTALLAADYSKAESLYRAALDTHRGDARLTAGLVHALLREQKVQEAADAVTVALAAAPNLPALITLRGEVEFRQGAPWMAGNSASDSLKLDPCNPRTYLLAADVARIMSLYATERRTLTTAHQLDPQDPDIRAEWIETLPIKQRVPELEAYLAAPSRDDAEDLRHLRMYLDHLKKLVAEPHKHCHLVSEATATEIPFDNIMYLGSHVGGFGLVVKLNNHASLLQIDTGASGILVSRSSARRAGLVPFSKAEVGGIGDEGTKPSYTAYADSIRVGNLEFQDCAVEVMDSSSINDDQDGLIGMDVFSDFLVTLDWPMRKVLLGPLPARPGEAAGAKPQLNTADEDEDDSASAQPPANPTPAPAAPSSAAGLNSAGPSPAASAQRAENPTTAPVASKPAAPHGPFDRYIAPEMKDYTPIYRVGHDLILPAALNGKSLKLFILDTGSWATTISPQAAREVSKLYFSAMPVEGLNGKVDKVYATGPITFTFAHLTQRNGNVMSFDTSAISKSVGMEISGLIGGTTLDLLTTHIDYRDGLVKFDYVPDRGYKY